MTRIQQVCWELETDYLGHPYYVSGNAIYHALTTTLSGERHDAIHASHGVFTPGQFGVFPDKHSQSGTRPALGATLPEVETYDDLFLHRHQNHRWLLDSRPRDALNACDIRTQSGQPALAHETVFGKPASAQKNTQTTGLFVHAYLHAEKSGILPLEDDVLDSLQFGGQRNYGYGMTRLKATQTVDLNDLEYTRLEECDSFALELVTPFVLRSTYPDTNDVDIPWWWSAENEASLRTREERVVEGGDVYRCETIDHGQTLVYTGNRPVETAKNTITRVGTHSKYGFGEIRVRPLNSNEITLSR